jgi:hypothetical protein
MKLDKFTWIVIGAVVALLVAAVLTVNLTGGAGTELQEYLPPDTPEAPVYNAFLAFQRGDVTTARAQYNEQMLEDMKREQGGYDPLLNRGTTVNSNQRMRVTKTEVAPDDANRALITAVIDTYNEGGPFGAGSTWSRELIVEVVRQEDGWKINTQEFFY